MYDPITVARFWSKVDVRKSGSCWMWQGAKRGGYGNIKIGGASMNSNRVAWEIANEASIGDRMALHRCDVKLCCNPNHIYAGTASDNMIDMNKRGLRHANVLNADSVREIRKLAQNGVGVLDIANQFDVQLQTAQYVLDGRTWGYVQ